MPKSKIIIDIVEDRVDLMVSLNRLLVLAKDVKNNKLSKWAISELNGYKPDEDLPEYRIAESRYIQYSGINGRLQVKNQPLPLGMIKTEMYDELEKVKVRDGIKTIIDYQNDDTYRDLTFLASEVFESSGGHIQCVSIRQLIPASIYKGIYSEVKSKLLLAFCELERKYGCLDELVIDVSKQKNDIIEKNNEELNHVVLNVNLPELVTEKKERWYEKIAWNIVIPIITGIIGAVAAAVILKFFGI